ncbi:mannonate dehydratase [Treponema sp. OMZ 840]|uniref:mannonate dehydratase n=1 Tax=Treponema sp. OMZ 840 TaxID=244313 RepID=UPI003D8BDA18
MKLGIGLYRHMLDRNHFKFAKQLGCSHVIVHLVNYYSEKQGILPATDDKTNYGESIENDFIWSYDGLKNLKDIAAEEGIEIYGIENFSPADWYDVLLDGPHRDEQVENLKRIIANVGRVGIRNFGYNFSIAGVWGHKRLAVARGGAVSVCFDASALPIDASIPDGEVWNMTYRDGPKDTFIAPVSHADLWNRFERFLNEILPVCEKSGVALALHPDDPPMPELRQTARLVYQPKYYDKLINLNKSPMNQLEFCLGSLKEMSEGNIYKETEKYSRNKRISYIHFRNVKGTVPKYDEVFLDEGDIDMFKILRILRDTEYTGLLIPDHTPEMTCPGSWYAGMAYAIGYMKAAIRAICEEKCNE